MKKLYCYMRSVLLVGLLMLGSYVQASHPLQVKLDSIVRGKAARVGVSVVYDDNEAFAYNARQRFPLLSVFKFHQALAVLHYLDQQQLPLDTELFISKSDLQPDTWSPLREVRPEGNFRMTIADLLRYSISQSDNNACDILFRYLGGTDVVESYIRELGIKDFKIEATEEKMHEAFEYQYLNWATPVSVIRLMEKFRKEPLFKNPEYKVFLEKTMSETSTGNDKLKAGLPEDVMLEHKTGSSDRSASGLKAGDNDMGFVRLPGGGQYIIAVFVSDSQEDDETNAAIIAEISRQVYEYYKLRAKVR